VEVKKYSPELISKLRTKKSWNDLQDLLTHSYKSYDGKIYTVYTGPELKSLSVKKFNAIDERLKKFFDYNCKETVSKWGGQVHKEESYSLNIPKYTIEVRVKKNMVTQMKKIDPEVVSEYTKIDAILNSYFRDFQGGRSSWYGFKDKYELKRQRRHSNDAIAKIKSGEIDDTQQYHKLNKLKKRV
jgi:hypothetical protein